MKTMLNPQGRIGPITFRNAAMILIAVGAVLSVLPAVSPALTVLSFVSLVLIYPWLVIWVKRFHDAGKSGGMFLGVLVLWLIVSLVATFFISAQFAPPQAPVANPIDLSAVMATVTAQAQATALPSTIVSAVISLAFVLAGNALLRSDPEPNAYGPPHAR
jgi:uncharacterized membrane protein YhaH (DUF805 family)